MIQETRIEICVVAAYANGDRFCIAKFMHEEDARRYKRSRPREDYLKWELWLRTESIEDGVRWEAL